ncbi:MAG: hypothetical protein U5P41_12315 [Gammaproteobacteria bacterium]|nr:hypothetical protein [Gammaproteobacteria bacterium]
MSRYCPRPSPAFRLPWHWDGKTTRLKARATDETGYVQPERSELIAERGNHAFYHFNGILAFEIAADGTIEHVLLIRISTLALVMTLAASTPAGSEESTGVTEPALGQPAPDELVARWNISVFPDGRSLPEGAGSVAEGKKIYEQQCIACHARCRCRRQRRPAGPCRDGTDRTNFPQKTIANYWPHATQHCSISSAVRCRCTIPAHSSDDETYACRRP